MRQEFVDSGFGNSIYWTLPVCNYNYSLHNVTSHKPETCLLSPVSLQTSYLICLPVSLFYFVCISLLTRFNHSLKTVLHELNRKHLVDQLGLSLSRNDYRCCDKRFTQSLTSDGRYCLNLYSRKWLLYSGFQAFRHSINKLTESHIQMLAILFRILKVSGSVLGPGEGQGSFTTGECWDSNLATYHVYNFHIRR
jgi:hypothetical protein